MSDARLTPTQRRYLRRLRDHHLKRMRYGKTPNGGIPERTADALVRLGYVRVEWQPIRQKEGRRHHVDRFCVLVTPTGGSP